MTHFTLFVLFGLVGENSNLLGLAVFQHLGFYAGAGNGGSAKLGVFSVDNCQYLIEGYGCFCFCVQFLNVDHVACLNAVLLATSNDNCLHYWHLPFLL